MSKFIVAIIALIVLTGCGQKIEGKDDNDRRSGFICDKADIPKMQEFQLTCIKNGNPMSDEEPEDLISACGFQSRRLYCGQPVIYYKQTVTGDSRNVIARDVPISDELREVLESVE